MTTAAGAKPGGAALDIEELLCAEVRTKARFSDGVVGKLHRRTRGRNRIAAMGDVGKRTAVDEGEVAFDRLHEVGLEGFKKQSQKGARGTEFAAGVGRAGPAQAQNDAVDAGCEDLLGHWRGKARPSVQRLR